jgi:hypothetical protein
MTNGLCVTMFFLLLLLLKLIKIVDFSDIRDDKDASFIAIHGYVLLPNFNHSILLLRFFWPLSNLQSKEP